MDKEQSIQTPRWTARYAGQPLLQDASILGFSDNQPRCNLAIHRYPLRLTCPWLGCHGVSDYKTMAVGGTGEPAGITERSPVGFDNRRRVAHVSPAGTWRCHPPKPILLGRLRRLGAGFQHRVMKPPAIFVARVFCRPPDGSARPATPRLPRDWLHWFKAKLPIPPWSMCRLPSRSIFPRGLWVEGED